MEQEKTELEDLSEKATIYLNTRLELGQLKAMEYGALTFAAVLGKMVILMVFFCCLIFSSLALAIYLSVCTRNPWLGSLLVAGFYLIVFVLVYVNRRRILHLPFANMFIRQITGSHEK